MLLGAATDASAVETLCAVVLLDSVACADKATPGTNNVIRASHHSTLARSLESFAYPNFGRLLSCTKTATISRTQEYLPSIDTLFCCFFFSSDFEFFTT